MKSFLWKILLVVGLIGVAFLLIQRNLSMFKLTSVESMEESSPISPPSSLVSFSEPSPTSTLYPSSTSKSPLPTPAAAPDFHTVQEGEFPAAIAARYGVTVEALMAANNITDPTTLQIGQKLLIPTASEPAAPSAAPSVTHEIENGDTLFSLAVRYGSTVEDILANNPGLEPTSLQIGQEISIPLTQPTREPRLTPTQQTIITPEKLSTDLTTLAQEMIDGINAERQAQGLAPLVHDEQLATVAQAHAQDMVARDYFDHVTPEGKTLRDRLRERGLELNWVGENIQRNTEPAEETVQTAIDWFMGSKPHRNNILHLHYNHLGVGVAEGPPGWYTFVLVFAER
jgi:uncharacterized protein YkwD